MNMTITQIILKSIRRLQCMAYTLSNILFNNVLSQIEHFIFEYFPIGMAALNDLNVGRTDGATFKSIIACQTSDILNFSKRLPQRVVVYA